MSKKEVEVRDTADQRPDDEPESWTEQVDSGTESVEILLPDGTTGEMNISDAQRTEALQGELLVEEADAEEVVDEDDVDETV